MCPKAFTLPFWRLKSDQGMQDNGNVPIYSLLRLCMEGRGHSQGDVCMPGKLSCLAMARGTIAHPKVVVQELVGQVRVLEVHFSLLPSCAAPLFSPSLLLSTHSGFRARQSCECRVVFQLQSTEASNELHVASLALPGERALTSCPADVGMTLNQGIFALAPERGMGQRQLSSEGFTAAW